MTKIIECRKFRHIRSLKATCLCPRYLNGKFTPLSIENVFDLFVCKITASSALIFLGWAPWGAIQKWIYACICSRRTAYFRERRKNSLHCAEHEAARFRSKITGSYALLDSQLFWRYAINVLWLSEGFCDSLIDCRWPSPHFRRTLFSLAEHNTHSSAAWSENVDNELFLTFGFQQTSWIFMRYYISQKISQ